jgi:hypothetical protein
MFNVLVELVSPAAASLPLLHVLCSEQKRPALANTPGSIDCVSHSFSPSEAAPDPITMPLLELSICTSLP